MKAHDLLKLDGTSLTGADIKEGQMVDCEYINGSFVAKEIREPTREESERTGFEAALDMIDAVLGDYEERNPELIEEIRDMIDDNVERIFGEV